MYRVYCDTCFMSGFGLVNILYTVWLGCLRLGFFQVHSTSKKLLYQLDHLVQVCHQTDPADMVSKCIIR